MLRPPQPILVADLFPQERAGLLAVLDSTRPDDWFRPTACPGWSVKDLVAHLLADDLGLLSRGRDGYEDRSRRAEEPLVEFINRRNEDWVTAARRLSPAVLRALLAWSGLETAAWFASREPMELGAPVSWAGPEPAPVWLDVARELTERWHHGEQIREAVGAPSADDPALLRPVLRTFAHSLPVAFAGTDGFDGASVVLLVLGPAGGAWTVSRESGAWRLYEGAGGGAAASVTLSQGTAWRMYTRMLSVDELERRARLSGDTTLARQLLTATGIIA